MSIYADRVDYFTWGNVSKSVIHKDKANHFRRWPQINSEYDGVFTVSDVQGSPDKIFVSFHFNFDVKNDKKSARGVVDQKLILQLTNGSLTIIDEKQHVLNRDIRNN